MVYIYDKDGNLLTKSDIDVIVDSHVKTGLLEQSLQKLNTEQDETIRKGVEEALSEITREDRI